MKSIKVIEFESPIRKEWSAFPQTLLLAESAHSSMELFVEEDETGHMLIEWVVEPPVDEVELIGIWVRPAYRDQYNWFGNTTLTWELVDYDGVFELPAQAIELLESVGIVVGEDFRGE